MRHHSYGSGTFALRQCLGWLNLRRNVSSFFPQAMGWCPCVPPSLQLRQDLFLVSPVRSLAPRITGAPAAGEITCIPWSLLVWRPLALLTTLPPHLGFCSDHSQNCGHNSCSTVQGMSLNADDLIFIII